MTWTRAALVLVAVAALALVAFSGGSGADPETPPALPGLPPPFLGTAVAGSGGLTAAVDAYGDVVDLRLEPAGPALIENPAERQAAGTVGGDTGIVPRVSIDGGPGLPLWQADSVKQRYLPGTNVVRTTARFGGVKVVVTLAAVDELALAISTVGEKAEPEVGVEVEDGVRCRRQRQPGHLRLVCRVGRDVPVVSRRPVEVIEAATDGDRHWLAKARPLGSGSPDWAVAMYHRSLLILRALTDARTGAVAAGARDGWAYVWPRDAATAALAYAAAGYRREARRVAEFLRGLDLGDAARFYGDGTPVPGRGPQGDASGWVAVASEAAGLPPSPQRLPWRDSADYQEGDPGDYLGNAIASELGLAMGSSNSGAFETKAGLVRRSDDPDSGLDSAAAWAVRPFSVPVLYPQVRRTLRGLVADGTPYGITPGTGWHGGVNPWTAPTAWTSWSLAALGDRDEALGLLADLRRAATPAGALPERVDVRSGIPSSTTPLAWSHAFAVLALRELWP